MNRDDFGRFGGSLTADVLNFNPDAIPKPDTLYVRMTRGERRIADELRREFGGFKRVVIDVDGEQHEFHADSLIRLLEGYEGSRDASRWFQLFGTPERAARTLRRFSPLACSYCALEGACGDDQGKDCLLTDYDALLKWLRGDAE